MWGEVQGIRSWRRGRTSRIQRIDVDAEIYWFLAHSLADFLNDTFCADGVDFSRFDDFEAAIAVVVVVAHAGKGGADAGVDVGVVGEETFGVGVVEVGAVVDGGLLCRGAAEDTGTPCVAVKGDVRRCD